MGLVAAGVAGVAAGLGAGALGASTATAAAIGLGAAGLVGSMGASQTQANAATQAAQTQANAATQASNNTLAQYQQTRADLQPYTNTGYDANKLMDQSVNNGSLTAPVSLTESQLEQTPGYQFNLTQGLKATQNSAAARGLGISGAAMKGAAGYATGLADSTYQNQFNDYQTQQTNAYNRLMGATQLGQNSAATAGAQGLNATQNANNYLTGGAAASAAGTMGAANAYANGIGGGLGSLNNAFLMYGMSNGMFNQKGVP